MQTEAAVPKPGLMNRPLGLALAILAAVVVWSFSPLDPVRSVLLVVAGLLLLGLRRPVWAMAALLVSQLTVTSYVVDTPLGFTISLRLLLLMFLGFIVWRSSAQQRLELGPKARRVLIPAAVLLAVSTIANLVSADFVFAFKDFRNMAAGLLIIVLLAAVVRNVRDLKILCGVAFAGIAASALIGLTQHYDVLGMADNTLIPNYIANSKDHRVPGMAETELEFAYVLAVGIPVLLGLMARGVRPSTWNLLVVAIVVMGVALYFTYTRSALLALVLGLVALALFSKTRIRGDAILAALFIVVLFASTSGVLEGQYLSGRTEDVQEQSSMARRILWQSGLAIVADNPITGIGGGRFQEVSVEYSSEVDPALLEWEQETYWGYRTLGADDPHNDFLGMWVAYGTIGLAAYVWLFVAVLRNLLESYRATSRRFLKGLALGLAAGLAAYAANAFYHNCFAALPLFWVMAGFSVAVAKLAFSGQGNQQAIQER